MECPHCGMNIREFWSVRDAAKHWRLSPRRVRQLLEQGRVPGAFKQLTVWLIPAGTIVPVRHPVGRPVNS